MFLWLVSKCHPHLQSREKGISLVKTNKETIPVLPSMNTRSNFFSTSAVVMASETVPSNHILSDNAILIGVIVTVDEMTIGCRRPKQRRRGTRGKDRIICSCLERLSQLFGQQIIRKTQSADRGRETRRGKISNQDFIEGFSISSFSTIQVAIRVDFVRLSQRVS